MSHAKRKGRPGSSPNAPRPSDPTHAGAEVTPDANGNRITYSVPSNRAVAFTCPVCNEPRAAYEWKRDRDGRWRYLIGCAKCASSLSGGEYLRELGAHVGATGAQLLDDPGEYLEMYRLESYCGPPPPLPGPKWVRRWAVNTHREPAPLEYLLGERGLSAQVVRAARIGWAPTWNFEAGAWCGPEALFLPMYRDGRLVAFKTRRLDGDLMKPAGSGVWDWPLWPEPQRQRRRAWTWLVEGEWDALRLLSEDIPATSVTGGKDQWRDEWAEQLRGLRVHVMFDVGAEAEALERVRTLRAAGVWAKHEPATALGLTKHNADVSDYLNAGGDVDALRRRARSKA